MEQSDINELLAFFLANGDTPETRKHIAHFLLSQCVQTSERCARIVERWIISSDETAIIESAPTFTIRDMNSILAEIAAEIRLAGWK